MAVAQVGTTVVSPNILTFTPTAGNLVVFVGGFSNQPAGWLNPQVGAPFFFPVTWVTYKRWAVGDSVSALFSPISNSFGYAAFEYSGVDPSGPITLSSFQGEINGGSSGVGPGIPVPTVAESGSLAFWVFQDVSSTPGYASSSSASANNGFSQVAFSSIAPEGAITLVFASPGLAAGFDLSTSLADNIPDTVSPPGQAVYDGTLFVINAVPPPPPPPIPGFVSTFGAYTDSEEFYHILRPQVTR